MTSILNSIRSSSPPIRVYHLQVLLFFIDRHWYILHDTLQQHVMSILLQCIAHDDSMTRSWAFLCCAAVAHADGDDHALSSSQSPSLSDTPHSPRDSTTWDTIWTHAVRRANDPSVCRVACHAAHALLLYLNATPNQSIRTPLASHRVLAEIENFAKDLDVQGPSHPHGIRVRVLDPVPCSRQSRRSTLPQAVGRQGSYLAPRVLETIKAPRPCGEPSTDAHRRPALAGDHLRVIQEE